MPAGLRRRVEPLGLPEFLLLIEDADEPGGLPYAALAELASISSEEARELEGHWSYWPEERVRELFVRLNELVESDPRLEFECVFLVGLGSTDGPTRALSVRGLAENNRPELVRRLCQLLRDDEAEEVRVTAALGMTRLSLLAHEGKLPPAQAAQVRAALTESFNDELESIAVRRRALEALGVFQDEVVEAFIEIAHDYEDVEMRVSSLQAMGRSCNARWLEQILPALEDDDPSIRYEAALALGQVGDESHVALLSRMLDDEDLEVQVAATTSLGVIAGPTAIRLLQALLRSPEPAVKQAAIDALRYVEVEDMTLMEYRPVSEADVEASGSAVVPGDEDVYIDDLDLAEAGFIAPDPPDTTEWLDDEEGWIGPIGLTDEDLEMGRPDEEE